MNNGESNMHDDWKQNQNAETDSWNRVFESGDGTHVSMYVGTNRYYWMARRGDYRLSGVETGRDAAIEQAEAAIAMPIGEFNQRVANKLIVQLHEIESDLMRLCPNTDLLLGYHTGYEAGASDVKRRIYAAMDIGETEAAELAPT